MKRLLEDDGLADASLVHAAQVDRLGNLFGADAIRYIVIQALTYPGPAFPAGPYRPDYRTDYRPVAP